MKLYPDRMTLQKQLQHLEERFSKEQTFDDTDNAIKSKSKIEEISDTLSDKKSLDRLLQLPDS